MFAGLAQDMKLDVVQVQQWLSDISATRAQDGLDDGFEMAESRKKAFLEKLDRFRAMYRLEKDTNSLALLDKLEAAMSAYYTQGKKMAQAYIDGGASAGNKMMAEFDAVAAEMQSLIDPFRKQQLEELNSEMDGTIQGIDEIYPQSDFNCRHNDGVDPDHYLFLESGYHKAAS